MNLIKEDILSTLPKDLITKSVLMSKAYEYLYCIENLLRLYLESHERSTQIIFPAGIKRNIATRREDEKKHKWISLRGNSDLFYLDFKDLNSIISNNWEVFKDDFPSLNWIQAKLDDLTRYRNLIAHNSYVDESELDLIRINFNAIVKQLGLQKNKIYHDSNNNKNYFVEGLNRSVTWTPKHAGEGAEYNLNYTNDILACPLLLRTFFMQHSIFFQVVFENCQLYIYPKFDLGWNTDEIPTFKNSCLFQIGQYDIDSDGIEELFICLQDNSLGDNGVQLNVFKYYPPQFLAHTYRSENWQLLGSFKGSIILGEPKAFVSQNSITVPRNLRGFFYEWTFTRGRFISTGNM